MSGGCVVLCPGQGAQRVGMGRAWAERSAAARRIFDEADRALGDRLGAPLSALCFNGPEDRLNRTDAAQPALFVAGVASVAALREAGALPPMTASAGLSLGEYTALHLAGCMSFADALGLVTLRGRAMQDAAEASDGGMVALIGADESQARDLCARAAPAGSGLVLVPANLNAPGQVVVSGAAKACDAALTVAESMSLRATRLAVAGAFHSPLMAPAAERLAAALESVEIRPPGFPVVSNVTARPHAPDAERGLDAAASIRARLVEQLEAPVRWDDSCRWLIEHHPDEMHEAAPGKVLAGLMRRIDRNTKVMSHDEPD